MDNEELLQAVSELIEIAIDSICETVNTLTDETDDTEAADALSACIGHVETIMMAVEMADSSTLLSRTQETRDFLSTLTGEATRYVQLHGQDLVEWSRAVLDYVLSPDDATLADRLVLPSPEALRNRDALSGSDLKDDTIEDDGSPEAFSLPESDGQLDHTALSEPPDISSEELDGGDLKPLLEPEAEGGLEPPVWPDIEMMADTSMEAEAVKHIIELPFDELAPVDSPTDHTPMTSSASIDDDLSSSPELATADMEIDSACSSDVRSDAVTDHASIPMADEREPTHAESIEAYHTETSSTFQLTDQPDSVEEYTQDDFANMVAQVAAPLDELNPWREILMTLEASENEVSAAAIAYVEIVGQVRDISEAIGLSGLSTICEHVSHNLSLLAQQAPGIRVRAHEVLAQWPELVQAYLKDFPDDTNNLDLVNLLRLDTWPAPLDALRSEALCMALSPHLEEPTLTEERPTRASSDDVSLTIADDIDPRLMEVFLRESPDHAAEFSACIAQIGHGDDVFNNLSAAQRLSHSMKGSANLVGVTGIANLTHHVEDIMEYLSEHHITPQPALVRTLQEVADAVEMMLDALRGQGGAPPEAQRILQDVLDWARLMDAGQLEVQVTPSSTPDIHQQLEMSSITPPTPEPTRTDAEGIHSLSPSDISSESLPTAASFDKILRIPLTTVDQMYRIVGELSIALDQLQSRLGSLRNQSSDLRAQDHVIQQRGFELESFVDVRHVSMTQRQLHSVGSQQDTFDPLELNEYDELYSSTRSYIEAVTDSRRMMQHLRSELSAAETIIGQLQRTKRELETTVRYTRMEKVSTISSRLHRCVRQACRATSKEAQLQIEGETVLLDNEILDKLADPLMHILRNAVDHGIETTEQRRANGKPEIGTIRLRFLQEGNAVVVQCHDDGQGLEHDRIRDIAVSKNLLDRNAVVDHETISRLVLTPGFSTRATATQLSGRGVGLDVVYTFIKDLKGTMAIGNGETGGCRIDMRLPLTLMTTHCLVVSLAGESYAIPATIVVRAFAPRTGRFSELGAEMVYEIGQEIYPARSLAQYLQLSEHTRPAFDADQSILLVHCDTGVMALSVDDLLESSDLVIKSLGMYVRSVRGIAGVATLADGSLLPVLDLAELLRTPMHAPTRQMQSENGATALEHPSLSRILIVDDSLSVRQSLSQLIQDAGFEVLEARDGVEAVELIRKQSPDLVLTDIEMPRMNGLDLVSYIRNSYSDTLPVVIITSRTTQKHRQQALDAGATPYVTKPYAEDELLSNIQQLIS